jgi:diaminopimelate decarboxylase
VTEKVRSRCQGIAPLSARLEPWQEALCGPASPLSEWMDEHGSPINLLDPAPVERNAGELREAAAAEGIELGVYFARKANKALAFVDEARRLGLGIDLASERELSQALDRGVPGDAMVITAAIKPPALMELCAASGTTVVIDNADELAALVHVARDKGTQASVALRLAPDLGPGRAPTRFGFTVEEAIAISASTPTGAESPVRIDGVHFHLGGYDPAERFAAIGQALELSDAVREHGHRPAFIDMGGGVPVSYLDSLEQWDRFWREHRDGLLGRSPELTFNGHGLGLLANEGEVLGTPAVYPFHQPLTRGPWLTEVLAGEVVLNGRRAPVAEAIRSRGLELRCQPGRALLDGCGMTAARVAFRKQRRDGTWLIGVEMNRTQCRSSSDDFMVDPLLVGSGGAAGTAESTGPIEGYLVGAYCMEHELLTWRRLRFPEGVAVGDVVVFPNTAGYLMHIMESSSHQIPLARNLVVTGDGSPAVDPIDA